MNFSTGHATVDAIGELRLTGNVVHHSWYQHIRYSNKRGEFTDPWAVLILADIVYWYRPVEVRDEQSGHLIGYRKKFSEDKLQRSPSAFAELLHCSEKVIRESLGLLETLGLIDIELRAVKTGFGVVPTSMFIGLNPQELQAITHNTSKAESTEKSFLPKSVRRNADLGKEQCRNGQGATPISARGNAEMGNSSIYKDFSEDFSHTKSQEGSKSVCALEQSCSTKSEEEETSNNPSPSLIEKAEGIPQTRDIPEIKDSAAPCDNNSSRYIMHPTTKQDVMFQRPKIDPWLNKTGLNGWKPEFLEFYREYLSSTPRYLQNLGKQATTGDAKNSLIGLTQTEEGRCKIQNHWENYQASLTPSAPTTQHQAELDTVHQPRKLIKLAGRK